MSRLFVSIVLDGVGVGAQPDAADYGDEGSDTLGHVCEVVGPRLPNLERFGLGNIRRFRGVASVEHPAASWGRMTEVSAGKDSTTGHWELAGLRLSEPFPTYPDGFPVDLLESFMAEAGVRGVLGNRAASGTAILDDLGSEHVATALPIVYTSADSVFQVAAHVDVVPLDRLYAWCTAARERVCTGRHAVGRVIARPFEGRPGAWHRLSDRRMDFALRPPQTTIQEALQARGIRTVAIGKIGDLFAGTGFDEVLKTKNNTDGMDRIVGRLGEITEPTFVWINLVDFDQDFGHRNDPTGFSAALEAFDRRLPEILDAAGADARVAIMADHGNDPTTPGTDHTREYVPILYRDGRSPRDLGLRPSFNDHAATIADCFGVPFVTEGRPF